MSIKIIIVHGSNAASIGPHLWPPSKEVEERQAEQELPVIMAVSLLEHPQCTYFPQISFYSFAFVLLFLVEVAFIWRGGSRAWTGHTLFSIPKESGDGTPAMA